MRFKAHDYQQAAIDYVISHPRCALFLDMGLGKTVITLSAIQTLLLDSFDVSRVLIVAPLRVARDTWADEVAKWDHLAELTIACAVGGVHARQSALAQDALVTTINRENVSWLVERCGRAWPFDMVVLDESSSFKSHQSKRFKALRSVLPHIKRMVALTGTPAANGLLDLWAQFRLLDGGERLGRGITNYREEFFVPDKRNGAQVFTWKPKPSAEEEIYRRIGDITMSMRAIDHLTLPEATFSTLHVTLPPSARAAYATLGAQMLVEVSSGIVDAGNAAGLANKLLQCASGAVYTDEGGTEELHRAKLEALDDLVEAACGSPVMVAYWFTSDLARILAAFPQARELKSAESMRQWNGGRIPIGVIHPASAGHGLNLQRGGHHLVWFTVPWSLELYQQTNGRLYRQGQVHPVSVHHLVARDTIDERVMAALSLKDLTQSALVDAVRAELGASGSVSGDSEGLL